MSTTKAQLHASIAAKDEHIAQLERRLKGDDSEIRPSGFVKRVKHGFRRAYNVFLSGLRKSWSFLKGGVSIMYTVTVGVVRSCGGILSGSAGLMSRKAKQAVLDMYSWVKDIATRVWTWSQPRFQTVWSQMKVAYAWVSNEVRSIAQYMYEQAVNTVLWTASFIGDAMAVCYVAMDKLAAVLGKFIARLIAPTIIAFRLSMMEENAHAKARQSRAVA